MRDLVGPAMDYASQWKCPQEPPEGFTAQSIAEGLNLDGACRGVNEGLWDISSSDLQHIGGTEGFMNIFIRAYERFHVDPHLRVLFNETPTQRSPEEHGKLLGGFLLMRIAPDDTYRQLRMAGYGHGLGGGHYRARTCPLRPKQHRGARFLHSQALSWLVSFSSWL